MMRGVCMSPIENEWTYLVGSATVQLSRQGLEPIYSGARDVTQISQVSVPEDAGKCPHDLTQLSQVSVPGDAGKCPHDLT
jgi:hypothetical protein